MPFKRGRIYREITHEIHTVQNANSAGIVTQGPDLVNIHEIAYVFEKVKDMIDNKKIKSDSIVVMAPYDAQVRAIKVFLDSRGLLGISCVTIQSSSSDQHKMVIVSLTGGVEFLDDEDLFHRLMTCTNWKIHVIISPFYELVPPKHALSRFLVRMSVFKRDSWKPEFLPMHNRDVGIDRDPERLLKDRCRRFLEPELDTNKCCNSIKVNWYIPSGRFRLEITIRQSCGVGSATVYDPQSPRSLQSDVFGSVLFKFLDSDSKRIQFEGKLCEAAAFGQANYGRISVLLLCQQISQCAAYLIPNKNHDGRFTLEKCDGIDILFILDTKLMPIDYVVESAIAALREVSMVPLGVRLRGFQRAEKGPFEGHMDVLFDGHTEDYLQRLKQDAPQACVSFLADHNSAVAGSKAGIVGFIQRHRTDCVDRENPFLPWPGVFFGGMLPSDIESIARSTFISNHLVIAFAYGLMFGNKLFVSSKIDEHKSLLACQNEWRLTSLNRIDAIQYRLLGTMVAAVANHPQSPPYTRHANSFPFFRYETRLLSAQFIDNALVMFRYMMKRFLSEFMGKFLERETLQFIPECEYEWPKIHFLTTRYDTMLKQVPNDDRTAGSFYCDWEEVEFNQLLSRFSRELINNAGIPLKLHWFVLIDRSQKETILETLKAAGLVHGEDFFRVWGVKTRISGAFQYSRIVIELPWETQDKALRVMRDSPLFRKGYVLCRWCQFAQGNHISEQMGGSRKHLLIGENISSKVPKDLKMIPKPDCLCRG
jgi:hypothetical protein